MQFYNVKRQATRVPLEIPVQLDGGLGVSRDISYTGIYFTTNKSFEAGENLQFAFELAATGKKMLIDCRGSVVRVEKVKRKYGVAATIEKITYLN